MCKHESKWYAMPHLLFHTIRTLWMRKPRPRVLNSSPKVPASTWLSWGLNPDILHHCLCSSPPDLKSFTKSNHIHKVFYKVQNISLFGSYYFIGPREVFLPPKTTSPSHFLMSDIPFKIYKRFLAEALKCKTKSRHATGTGSLSLTREVSISSGQRRKGMEDRRDIKQTRQKHWCFVYFAALPGADLGTFPICVDSGTKLGKNLIFQSFTLGANGFLFPRLKTLKCFPPKMQHVSNSFIWTSLKS